MPGYPSASAPTGGRTPSDSITRARTSIGCSRPGYSTYDSTRSKGVSARTRSTSNPGTKTSSSPPADPTNATGRSVARKTSPVKYFTYCSSKKTYPPRPRSAQWSRSRPRRARNSSCEIPADTSAAATRVILRVRPRQHLDRVAVGDLVRAADALRVEARRRPPDPRARARRLQVLVDLARDVDHPRGRAERDRVAVPEVHADEARDAPDR